MSGQPPAAPQPDGGRSVSSGAHPSDTSDMNGAGAVGGMGGIRSLATLLGRRFLRPFRRLTGLYRRSIQLQVVATTLVLSIGVVLLLGVVVMNQVRNGMLSAKQQAAVEQADSGFKAATLQDLSAENSGQAHNATATGSGQTGATAVDGPDMGTLLAQQVKFLASSGAGQYAVVGMVPGSDLSASTGSDNPGSRAPRVIGNVDPDRSISAEIRQKVAAHPTASQSEYTTIYYLNNTAASESGLVVGTQLSTTGANPSRTSCTTCSPSPWRRRPSAWSPTP
jgi:two-component system, OmpR family, sensor histidine kinase MtrB